MPRRGLAGRGCEATPEELVAFIRERVPGPVGGELGDAELEGAAGGAWYDVGLEAVLQYLTAVPAWHLATSVDGRP